MGAGNKLDPGRVRLARHRQDLGMPPGARRPAPTEAAGHLARASLTVYSDESGRPPRPPEATSHGRARAVNGTISYLPPLFGLMLAGAVLRELLA
jgi:tRNA A37 threonylcarbamoyladenosine dehydratase